MNPTQTQVERFWKWCGFTYTVGERPDWDSTYTSKEYCIYPDGQEGYGPDLDLSNLFKYALSRARERVGVDALSNLLRGWISDVINCGIDPAIALFWILYEVHVSEEQKEGETITLEEATKILKKEVENGSWFGSEEKWKAALRLGIEAMKEIRRERKETFKLLLLERLEPEDFCLNWRKDLKKKLIQKAGVGLALGLNGS